MLVMYHAGTFYVLCMLLQVCMYVRGIIHMYALIDCCGGGGITIVFRGIRRMSVLHSWGGNKTTRVVRPTN